MSLRNHDSGLRLSRRYLSRITVQSLPAKHENLIDKAQPKEYEQDMGRNQSPAKNHPPSSQQHAQRQIVRNRTIREGKARKMIVVQESGRTGNHRDRIPEKRGAGQQGCACQIKPPSNPKRKEFPGKQTSERLM